MRVGIVNDLALAREALRRLVLSVPGYAVAWAAADGAEAVRRAAEDRPDVVLMDLLMPVMDGVEATRRITAQSPCPILLVTACVAGNVHKVYEALSVGGLDAVLPPTLGPDGQVRDGDRLLARLAKLCSAGGKQRQENAARCAGEGSFSPPPTSAPRPPAPVVALAASTGGPEALAQVLEALPAGFPAAVVVVQHIAADFALNLATWLQRRTPLPVRLAPEGAEPRTGEVLLAGRNDHLIVRGDQRLGYSAEPTDCPWRPSADALFGSLAARWPRPGVAAVLTGLGPDGARGLAALRRAGWYTLAQDEATSVAPFMPQAAAALGGACEVLPLGQIGPAVRSRLAQGEVR